MKSEEKGAEALFFFVQKGRNAEVVPFGVREGTSRVQVGYKVGKG